MSCNSVYAIHIREFTAVTATCGTVCPHPVLSTKAIEKWRSYITVPWSKKSPKIQWVIFIWEKQHPLVSRLMLGSFFIKPHSTKLSRKSHALWLHSPTETNVDNRYIHDSINILPVQLSPIPTHLFSFAWTLNYFARGYAINKTDLWAHLCHISPRIGLATESPCRLEAGR